MAERYELLLDNWLATVLEQKLTDVLRSSDLQDTLHLVEPHVTQYQGRRGIVSVEIGRSGPHKRLLIVESETVEVAPLLWEAGKQTISEVSDQVLGALPWVDSGDLRRRILSCLADDQRESP